MGLEARASKKAFPGRAWERVGYCLHKPSDLIEAEIASLHCAKFVTCPAITTITIQPETIHTVLGEPTQDVVSHIN